MSRPTIAVITPAHPARVRNGKLQRAMASVYEQTLLPDALHVAIDNDGLGAAPTRDRALQAAGTDWVAFLDSDDMFLPRHLELLMKHAQETGADFVYSWFKIMQEWPGQPARILDEDPVFPVTHYVRPFDPDDPIETTITVLVRRELAQQVGMVALDRGEVNSGEDRRFTLECVKAGAVVSHLVRKTWLWSHSYLDQTGRRPGNTSGLPGRGDWLDDARR